MYTRRQGDIAGKPIKQMRRRERPQVVQVTEIPLTPIRYHRTADQIAAWIRGSIANGSLRPGFHLQEVEIARAMQTSRMPVREALMQLEHEGLVVRKPNRGSFVTELTEKTLREVSTVRGLVEGFAASQAVAKLTRADFVRMDGLISEMLVAVKERDYSRLLRCDYVFHETIVHAAGNEFLEEVWRTMHGKVQIYISAINLVASDWKTLVESHSELLEALRTCNPDKARAAMEEHIDRPLDMFVARALTVRK